MLSPQTEQRCRPEQLCVRHRVAQLLEGLQRRRPASGPVATMRTRCRNGGYPSASRRSSSPVRKRATSWFAASTIGRASGWNV